ncbi:Retrovirus-related Pol polyprotein from transposon TNT 1-94 [Vitis vinifera]|uniref:Retrovirus-related Pol polyprotein from transposon TNT 1-94 n=1 Tax=Vitis vinifera TaxID=29760 RepID=A0A438CWK2_VITVI|nr:Retrovirus-related Pol polyprotein from transposon TNT 1-94 [Vitis vinifera]
MEANVAEKASALVAATDHGGIQTRQTIGCGIKRGKLYYLDLQSKDSNKLQQALMADGSEGEKKKFEIWLWHRRLGHDSFGYLKKLFPSLFAKSDISGFRCDICELAKSHRASFPLILNKSLFPFMVIHYDVWGSSKVPTLSGSRWFVTFIDDCTRMTWLYLMKTKDEVNLLFQNFHKVIETHYNAKVRVLCSDNGGEYQSSDLQKYLEGHDIIHQTTCSNTPQQNGVSERKNRHLLEVVRAFLIAAKTPISYWGEAITSATYLINRVPSSSINFQTPLQALTNVVVAPTVPNLPHRVFGCVAFVHLHKHQRTKLTSHALQCVFVGYALHKKGYRCYHPPTRRMFITMDVVFHEDLMYFSFESELQGEYHKEIQTLDYDYHISEEEESGQFELVNQEVGELDMSGQQFGSEDVFTEIPNQSSSVEGVLNLELDPFMKRLPHRHNRGCMVSEKAMSEGVQIEEVIVWVEAIPESMVWKETRMSGCQPVNTPIEEGLKLCIEPNQVSTDKGRYQRLVGRLVYLAHTRPDLAYALSVVSQYMHNPGEQHMNAVMRILRYLKNASEKGILFAKNVDHQSIEVYTDADWAGAVDDRRSTSGYFTFVGGNLVT